jgi:hypothetical protein
MGWLGVVIRVGVLWLLSLVVAIAGMELGHRMVGVPAGPSERVSLAARSPGQ